MDHSHLMKRKLTSIIFLSVALFSLLASLFLTGSYGTVPAAKAQDAQASGWLTSRGGKPVFVMGANYEGPVDRAWLMWDDDKFDAKLIEADFARAHSYGINTLRIFVQRSLRDNVNAGDFTKLDTVTALARKYNLYLLVTFTDWPEPDLAKVADLNGKIAAHLATEPSVLAYDVKNEPQFTDMAGAIYPTGTIMAPIQSPDTIAPYGERVARADIGDYRKSSEGRSIIASRLSDEQAYCVANYYKLYREFLDAGAAWVNKHSGTTTLDYIDSADAVSWGPFLRMLDDTMAAWIDAQLAPVRHADPGRPITAGYSNIVLAKLPSNRKLDFQSVHRFTSHGYAGLNATFLVLDNLQRSFAGQPVMLEEFGYPGQARSSSGGVQGYDPRSTANLESAVWAYLYGKGFAGGAKWMLNNFPAGDNPAENSYGLFDNGGQPKVTAYALRQLSDLFSRSTPGNFSPVRADDSYAVSYAYTSRDGLVVGGKVYTSTSVTYQANAPSQLVVGTIGGNVTLFATDVATAELNLPDVFGVNTADMGRIVLTGLDPKGQPWTPSQPTINGDWLRVNISPLYRYRLTVVPRAVERAPAQADVNTVYFPQTEHNLSGEFLKYWKSHGGLSIFGYPLTEAFTENGYTVQYFERNRFEFHPENQPPYNVLLGRLGADSITGRKFATVSEFEPTRDHRFFPETGHSLNNAFLGYWNRYGGLAQFGYPMSEEQREVSLTDGKEHIVQYFERARFEFHPEYKGTTGEVLLGLLGADTMKVRGWIP